MESKAKLDLNRLSKLARPLTEKGRYIITVLIFSPNSFTTPSGYGQLWIMVYNTLSHFTCLHVGLFKNLLYKYLSTA